MTTPAAPSVGVVVPAYQAARWLDTTLRSLQQQTFRDWVCVVIDDGSRDETRAVADRIAARDPRITVRSQANAGLSATRNAGTAALPAGVALVSYLDSDDVLLPDALRSLHTALVGRPDAVGAYGIAEYVDAHGEPFQPGEQPRRQRDRRAVSGRRLVSVRGTADAIFAELVVNGPIVPSCVGLLRRAAVLEAGGSDAAREPQEDWALYARMSRHGPFVALDQQVAWYRRHDGNATGRLAELQWAQAELRHHLWRDGANTRAQRRTAARAAAVGGRAPGLRRRRVRPDPRPQPRRDLLAARVRRANDGRGGPRAGMRAYRTCAAPGFAGGRRLRAWPGSSSGRWAPSGRVTAAYRSE